MITDRWVRARSIGSVVNDAGVRVTNAPGREDGMHAQNLLGSSLVLRFA